MKLYRIEAIRWPTPDGQPWARFYGPNAAVPNHEIPAWLAPLVGAAIPYVDTWRLHTDDAAKIRLRRVADRIRYDSDRDEIEGVLMPLPKRVNYLSASGVAELAADMRAFGAEIVVRRSDPVTWTEANR